MCWNVLPINDIKEHTNDSTCACNPKVIFQDGEMIVIHNSYDGREYEEELIEDIKKQFNYS